MGSNDEVVFLLQYFQARRDSNNAKLADMLRCLPVMLMGGPSEAFCATLASLGDGGVRADFDRAVPNGRANAANAFTVTAIDAICSMADQTLQLCEILQSAFGAPIAFN